MPRDVPPSCGTQERALNWESEDHDLNLVSATSSCVHWGCGLPRGMGRSPQFLFFKNYKNIFLFSSVTQSCPTFCDPMDCRTPGLPVHHQLPEFTQTHVHWVGDAIQPSHPLSSPSPPTFNHSQHQGLFQWVSSFPQVAKVLEFQFQPQSPMNIQDWFPSGWTGWISLQSKGLSRVFSNTTVQKHQLLGAQISSQSNSHIHTWPQEKP